MDNEILVGQCEIEFKSSTEIVKSFMIKFN